MPGLGLESQWSHSGVTVESQWSHSGVTVESQWSDPEDFYYACKSTKQTLTVHKDT